MAPLYAVPGAVSHCYLTAVGLKPAAGVTVCFKGSMQPSALAQLLASGMQFCHIQRFAQLAGSKAKCPAAMHGLGLSQAGCSVYGEGTHLLGVSLIASTPCWGTIHVKLCVKSPKSFFAYRSLTVACSHTGSAQAWWGFG